MNLQRITRIIKFKLNKIINKYKNSNRVNQKLTFAYIESGKSCIQIFSSHCVLLWNELNETF